MSISKLKEFVIDFFTSPRVKRKNLIQLNYTSFPTPKGVLFDKLEISDVADWGLFDDIAELIETKIDGKWTAQLDGLDERYWDYETNPAKITLHLQIYYGVSVHPYDMDKSNSESIELLHKIHQILIDYKDS